MKTQEQQALIPLNGEASRTTAISVLELAVKQGANVDTLTKLLELQERWEANEARKAFTAALAAFKSNPPKLEKVKQVNFASKSGGNVNYKYAPLDYICAEIGGALSKHGLSFTWNVGQETSGGIKVTCILRHEQGHSESVMVAAALHDDQRMNAIQRLGATITYLERYTLLAATGLATADQDTDGVTMQEAADFIAHMEDASTIEELKQRYQEAIKDALQRKNPKAIDLYMKAREKREKELAA